MPSNRDWYNSWTPLQEPINVVVRSNARCSARGTRTVVGVVVVRVAKSEGLRLRGVEETFIRLAHKC